MKKIFKPKFYKHIDSFVNIKDIYNNITNKSYITQHSFYPFISYTIDMKKYSEDIDEKTSHHYKIKTRPIKYASHMDRCIYQWYSHILNQEYNKYCEKEHLNDAVIAYRTCLKGQTNIEFAKRAIDFIKNSGDCYVLISDFSNFFDYIEHTKLKEALCEILNTKVLEEDVYKIYKSMTKYSYIEKKEIEEYLINNSIETKESIKQNESFFKNIKWKEVKKNIRLHRNKEFYGIPQGSPISGLFANIYMTEFDKALNKYALENNGLYMRYSDDLIIIIPRKKVEHINEIWNFMLKEKEKYSTLEMNASKSTAYHISNNTVKPLNDVIIGMNKGSNFITYLGFSYDGKNVKFKDKTLSKFYYKLYRKINHMKNVSVKRIKKGKRNTKIDKHWILKSLDNYSGTKLNFITYVKRAKKVFKNEPYIMNFQKNAKRKVFAKLQNK